MRRPSATRSDPHQVKLMTRTLSMVLKSWRLEKQPPGRSRLDVGLVHGNLGLG